MVRRWGQAAPGLLVVGFALSGHGLAAVAVLVVGLAVVLGRSWGRAAENVPAAVVVVTASMVTLAQTAHFAGWRLFGHDWVGRGTVAAAGIVLVALAVGLRQDREPEPPRRVSSAALAPGAVTAGYGLVSLVLPMPRRVEWFLGGDNVRHLWLAAEEAFHGSLEYADQTSPRAWHTMVDLVWSTGGGRFDGAGLVSLVSDMATLLWFAYAVLALGAGALAAELARRMGVPGGRAGLAGMAAGSAVLWPTFLGNYMVLGFETAIFCAVLLAAGALEVVRHPGSRRGVIVTVAVATLVAHTWQLLLPAAALAVVVAAWTLLRRLPGRSSWLLVVGALVAGAVVASPSIVALFARIGFERASIQGVPAPSIGWWLPLALVGATLAVLSQRDLAVRVVGLMALGTALAAVVVALKAGVPLSHYYPRKMLWQATLLGLPLTCALSAAVGSRIASRLAAPASRRLTVALKGLVVLFAGVSWVFPAMAVLGAWSTADARVVLQAASSPGAGEARVAWVGDRLDDTITRILLDFYRVSTPQDRTIQFPATVADECTLLEDASSPTVLSTRPLEQVRQRYSCVPAVRVIPAGR